MSRHERIIITDDVGDPAGTGLPVEAHQLLLWDWSDLQPTAKVLCPESGIGGCLIYAGERPGCWLHDWFDNIGGEMVAESDQEIIFDIVTAENLGPDGFTIKLSSVVDVQDGSLKL